MAEEEGREAREDEVGGNQGIAGLIRHGGKTGPTVVSGEEGLLAARASAASMARASTELEIIQLDLRTSGETMTSDGVPTAWAI